MNDGGRAVKDQLSGVQIVMLSSYCGGVKWHPQCAASRRVIPVLKAVGRPYMQLCGCPNGAADQHEVVAVRNSGS